MAVDLPVGTTVFLDANIFVYHAVNASDACSALLQRCERRELHGVTSAHVLLEVLHQLMLTEAVKKKLIRPTRPLQQLRRHPEHIHALSEYARQVDGFLAMGLTVLAIEPTLIMESQAFRQRYGLLTNDSISIRLMEREQITVVATADQDFRRVPSLTIWNPPDLGVLASQST